MCMVFGTKMRHCLLSVTNICRSLLFSSAVTVKYCFVYAFFCAKIDSLLFRLIEIAKFDSVQLFFALLF